MFETREGILKHCSAANARTLGDVGERFLKREQPSLEAQLANLADEIAYNNHDVDDGLRAGLITLDELGDVPLFARELASVRLQWPGREAGTGAGRRVIHETIRRMINHIVKDVAATSQARLAAAAPRNIDDVRRAAAPLVVLSDDVAAEHLELKRFLRERVYKHSRVLRMTTKAQQVLRELFDAFLREPALLPPDFSALARTAESQAGKPGRARVICDYVAGMTDRYAFLEHRRLFDPAASS
jgi:dGTPase